MDVMQYSHDSVADAPADGPTFGHHKSFHKIDSFVRFRNLTAASMNMTAFWM
jgi:hypothetical protein